MYRSSISRRDFLAASGAAALTATASSLGNAMSSHAELSATPFSSSAAVVPPIGIALSSVRTEFARDVPNTFRRLKQMGYQVVEFEPSYASWSVTHAKTMRRMLDDAGLKCLSTQNDFAAILPGAAMKSAVELTQILGARYYVLASGPPCHPSVDSPFGCVTADTIKFMVHQLWSTISLIEPLGMFAGYVIRGQEWARRVDGVRAADYIADSTPDQFMLDLDVGSCVAAGVDPVAWVNAHKGRIKCARLGDWAPGKDTDDNTLRVLFGEGTVKWKPLMSALESTGGVQFYLMEQPANRLSELDSAQHNISAVRALRKGG